MEYNIGVPVTSENKNKKQNFIHHLIHTKVRKGAIINSVKRNLNKGTSHQPETSNNIYMEESENHCFQ